MPRQNLTIDYIFPVAVLALFTLFSNPSVVAAEENDDAPNGEVTATGDDAIQPLSAHDRDELKDLAVHLRQEANKLADDRHVANPIDVEGALHDVSSPRSPHDIFQWINSNIDFEPYRASLRGADGALISRSANAVDQALLAQAMLEKAGHQTRFATGQLRAADAEQVLDRSLGKSKLMTDAAEPRSFADGSSPLRTSALRTLQQEHIWVEVNTGDRYRAFDPIASPTYGTTTATKDNDHAELPSKYEIEFEMVLVSDLDDGQTIEHLIVDAALSRVAFQALTLGFEYDSTRTRGHKPIIVYGDHRLEGTTIPVASLERLELRFRIQSAGHEHRWQQVLFRSGQGIDIFDFDHQHFAIAIAPGWVSEEKVRHVTSNASDSADAPIEHWLEAAADPDSTHEPADQRKMINAVLDRVGAVLPFAFARTLDRTTEAVSERLGVRPVLTRPRIVTVGLLRSGEDFHVDIQLDGGRIEAYPRAGIPVLSTNTFLSLYGLFRDELIGEMLSTYGDHRVTTVTALFAEARRQPTRFTTIDSQHMERLDLVSIGNSTKETIRDQIRRRNMTILAPLNPINEDGVERFGWWAVNPLDGNLEGHTSDAVVSIAAVDEGATIEIGSLIRSHLSLMARHFSAAYHASEKANRFPELVCSAAVQYERLARAFCATSQSLPRANVDSCLDSPPQPGGDLFSMTSVECADHLATFRCSAVFSTTLLIGGLNVGSANATPQSLPEPLCN